MYALMCVTCVRVRVCAGVYDVCAFVRVTCVLFVYGTAVSAISFFSTGEQITVVPTSAKHACRLYERRKVVFKAMSNRLATLRTFTWLFNRAGQWLKTSHSTIESIFRLYTYKVSYA